MSTPRAKPLAVSAIHQEDDTEPNDTQDEPDDTQDEPDNTQEQSGDAQEQSNTNLKRCRDYESSEDVHVESKAKKSKKEEAAPKRPRGRPRNNPEVTSNDKKAEKKRKKEFSVVVYVEVAVPPKLHAGKTHKGDKMVKEFKPINRVFYSSCGNIPIHSQKQGGY